MRHCFLGLLLDFLPIERNRLWVPQLFWFVLSADWETAAMMSGWLASKGKQGLEEHNRQLVGVKDREFFWGLLKLCVIAIWLLGRLYIIFQR